MSLSAPWRLEPTPGGRYIDHFENHGFGACVPRLAARGLVASLTTSIKLRHYLIGYVLQWIELRNARQTYNAAEKLSLNLRKVQTVLLSIVKITL